MTAATMKFNNNNRILPKLTIIISADRIERFATVLQAGFSLSALKDTSLSTFLADLPGFTEDYITNRLQTVFLNGDALDDFDITFSADTCVLALSAAMPGLAGAIFRKSSPAAGLRKAVVRKKGSEKTKKIDILVKYFNYIATEKGPDALSEGIVFTSADLSSFLELRPSLIDAMSKIVLDEHPIARDELLSSLSRHPQILLTCKTADG